MSGPYIDGAEAMYNALHVITDDARISNWLVRHDPQALTQARNALAQYAAEQNEVLNQLVEDDPDADDDDAETIYAQGVADGLQGTREHYRDSAQYDRGWIDGFTERP